MIKLPRILSKNHLRMRILRYISSESSRIASRGKSIDAISGNNVNFDVVVVGGGATGAGAALDAAARFHSQFILSFALCIIYVIRGLKVLCIEMEDFSSGTSSRSTKLLWGGSRYLVQVCHRNGLRSVPAVAISLGIRFPSQSRFSPS